MLESVPKNLSGESRLNYEQNMMDAMVSIYLNYIGLLWYSKNHIPF